MAKDDRFRERYENSTQQAITEYAFAELRSIAGDLTTAGKMLVDIKKQLLKEGITTEDIEEFGPDVRLGWVQVDKTTLYDKEAIAPKRITDLLKKIAKIVNTDFFTFNRVGVRNSKMKKALKEAISQIKDMKTKKANKLPQNK